MNHTYGASSRDKGGIDMKSLPVVVILIWSMMVIINTPCQGDDNLIYGCYQKSNGQLRIVSDTTKCKKTEIPIQWDQSGGPQGPPGPPGVGLNPLQIALLRWYKANETGISYPAGSYPSEIVFDGESCG